MAHRFFALNLSFCLTWVLLVNSAAWAQAPHRRRQERRPSGLLRFHGSGVGATHSSPPSKKNIRLSRSTPPASARKGWQPGSSPKPKRAKSAPTSSSNPAFDFYGVLQKGLFDSYFSPERSAFPAGVSRRKGFLDDARRHAQRDRLQQENGRVGRRAEKLLGSDRAALERPVADGRQRKQMDGRHDPVLWRSEDHGFAAQARGARNSIPHRPHSDCKL